MAVNVTRLYWPSFLAFTALIHLITALIHVVCHEVVWILVCLVIARDGSQWTTSQFLGS